MCMVNNQNWYSYYGFLDHAPRTALTARSYKGHEG